MMSEIINPSRAGMPSYARASVDETRGPRPAALDDAIRPLTWPRDDETSPGLTSGRGPILVMARLCDPTVVPLTPGNPANDLGIRGNGGGSDPIHIRNTEIDA